MAKHFKLRLSLSSFQFCRPKTTHFLPKDPTPATFCFSPVNPKSLDITYPIVPEPPPSTPEDLSFIYPLSPTTTAVDCGCTSLRNTKNHHNYYSYERIQPRRRLCNSSVSDTSDGGDTFPVRTQKPNDNTKGRNKKTKKKKAKDSIRRSNSSANSDWFSTDEDEESESLVSTSRSYNSSNDSGYSLETINEKPNRTKTTLMKKKKKKKIMNNSKVQRGKKVKAPVWKAEEKVNESYAVVKNSEDPCEDFKKSMLEMIMGKNLFEAKELEQLLLCFLSLNSRIHHAAIVEAFSDIWEILFRETPKSSHLG